MVLYEGRSFNCGTEVMPGSLGDLRIIYLFQRVGVFSFDRNSVFSRKFQADCCFFFQKSKQKKSHRDSFLRHVFIELTCTF